MRLELQQVLKIVRHYELSRTHGSRKLATVNQHWCGKTIADAIQNPTIKRALEQVDKSNWVVCEAEAQQDQQSKLARNVFKNVCNYLNKDSTLPFTTE
jgi:hypothetical protein